MQELGSQRLSEEEYRKSLEAKVLVEQLGNMITADVTANADEAESFYLTHKELFSHSRMVHVVHILSRRRDRPGWSRKRPRGKAILPGLRSRSHATRRPGTTAVTSGGSSRGRWTPRSNRPRSRLQRAR